MGKFIYRMCLIVILVITVAGGIYYYLTFNQQRQDLDQVTFVDKMDRTVRSADGKMFAQAQKDMQGEWKQAANAGGRLYGKVQIAGKETCGQAMETVGQAKAIAQKTTGQAIKAVQEPEKLAVKNVRKVEGYTKAAAQNTTGQAIAAVQETGKQEAAAVNKAKRWTGEIASNTAVQAVNAAQEGKALLEKAQKTAQRAENAVKAAMKKLTVIDRTVIDRKVGRQA